MHVEIDLEMVGTDWLQGQFVWLLLVGQFTMMGLMLQLGQFAVIDLMLLLGQFAVMGVVVVMDLMLLLVSGERLASEPIVNVVIKYRPLGLTC